MGKAFVSGARQITNRLMMERSKMLRDMGEAIETTCVEIANYAKAGHFPGAHAYGSYEKDTGTLTRSIKPELEKVTIDEVSGVVFSNVEYAPMVELGTVRSRPYPFLYPALVQNTKNLKRRLARALRR